MSGSANTAHLCRELGGELKQPQQCRESGVGYTTEMLNACTICDVMCMLSPVLHACASVSKVLQGTTEARMGLMGALWHQLAHD